MHRAVCDASGRADEAYAWLLEVTAPETSFDSRRSSGDFSSLDTKLRKALMKLLKAGQERKV